MCTVYYSVFSDGCGLVMGVVCTVYYSVFSDGCGTCIVGVYSLL